MTEITDPSIFDVAASFTQAPIELWVRDVGGNDGNVGSEAFPLKTLPAALAKIPAYVSHTVLIHCGDHSGTGYPFPIFPTKVQAPGAHIGFVGDGAGVGDGFADTGGGTLGVDTASTDVSILVDGSPLGGVDTEAGNVIEMLTGANAGQRRIIMENTAGEIIPSFHFNATPLDTDTFRIVRPTVKLDFDSLSGSDQQALRMVQNNAVLFFAQFDGRGTLPVSAVIRSCTARFYGIEGNWGNRAPAGFSGDGECECTFGTDRFATGTVAQTPVDLGLATNDYDWEGWGVVRKDSNAFQFPQGNPADVQSRCGGYFFESNWQNAGFAGRMTIAGIRLLGRAGSSTYRNVADDAQRVIFGTFDAHYYRMNAAGADAVVESRFGSQQFFEGEYNADSGPVFRSEGGVIKILPGVGFVENSASVSGDSVQAVDVDGRVIYNADPDTFVGRTGVADHAVEGNGSSPFTPATFTALGNKEVGDQFNIIKHADLV